MLLGAAVLLVLGSVVPPVGARRPVRSVELPPRDRPEQVMSGAGRVGASARLVCQDVRVTYGYEPQPRPGWGNPRAVVDAVEGQAGRAASARRDVADLTGTATSDDGLLRAVADGGGLRELVIDPRAMRMPSVDLAAAVVALARRAAEDLTGAREERLRDLGVERAPVDLDESLAGLQQLRALVESGHGDMRAVYERFRREAGR